MTRSARRPRSAAPTLVLLFLAGTTLGTAVRRGPTVVQDVAAAVLALLVAVAVVLLVRLVRRRRARPAPDGGRARPPAHGSERWSAPRRSWARPTVLSYGFYTGFVASPIAWWLPLVLAPGGLLVGLAASLLLRSSRRRRWAAARAAHPGRAVALVAVDPVAGMRLTRWARAVGATVPSIAGGDAVLAADGGGVALWRTARPDAPVHRWAWEDVALSSTSSATDVPHLVLTLLGPPPPARARAVPAVRRRFDLTLTVRTLGGTDPGVAVAATGAALDELLARRPGGAGPAGGADPAERAARAAPEPAGGAR